jgi:hypothetical protein
LKRIKRERERIGLGVRGKKGGAGGFWQKLHLLPPLRFRTEDREGGGGQLWRGGAPAALAAAAAGG